MIPYRSRYSLTCEAFKCLIRLNKSFCAKLPEVYSGLTSMLYCRTRASDWQEAWTVVPHIPAYALCGRYGCERRQKALACGVAELWNHSHYRNCSLSLPLDDVYIFHTSSVTWTFVIVSYYFYHVTAGAYNSGYKDDVGASRVKDISLASLCVPT